MQLYSTAVIVRVIGRMIAYFSTSLSVSEQSQYEYDEQYDDLCIDAHTAFHLLG